MIFCCLHPQFRHRTCFKYRCLLSLIRIPIKLPACENGWIERGASWALLPRPALVPVFLFGSGGFHARLAVLEPPVARGYCQSVNLGEACCIPTTGVPAADFHVQSLETYDSSSGNPIINCDSQCRFLINPLVDLIEDMFAYWPNLSCPSNNGMDQWRHVWCTYGNCTGLSEVVYFNRTLQLRERANILVTLQNWGIVPDASSTYRLEHIEEALKSTLGSSSFSVECERRYTVWPLLYQDYLTRIRICVSSDATTIVTCPTVLTTNCDSKVKFAPILYAASPGRQGDSTANPVRLRSAMDMLL